LHKNLFPESERNDLEIREKVPETSERSDPESEEIVETRATLEGKRKIEDLRMLFRGWIG
jgi:hypothetical protein